MRKYILLIILPCFQIISSQNTTAKLIDKNTKVPIPYATIKTGAHSGVISNEEGYFTLGQETNETTALSISCMGYQSKTITIKDIKVNNYIIFLDEAFNQLNEVYVSNRRPNVDSIIERVKRKIPENYNVSLKKYSIFYRASNYIDFEHLDFEIDKASHVKKEQLDKANNSLDALSQDIISSKTVHFKDFKADLFTQNKDSMKLVVAKATELIDQEKDFSLDEVQNRAQNIVLKYLDTTKTYKLKTGIFKVEDSLSLIDESKKDKKKNEYEVRNLKYNAKTLLNNSQFNDNSFLNKILDPKLYDYRLEKIVTNDGDLTYIIAYQPRKGKAKYTGKLFVSASNYAITKIDYNYFEGRHGEKFNLKLLLGIKFIENVSRGTIIYQKDKTTFYQPKYIKQEDGNYFYISRDLTLIENSRERYKVSSNFKIEGKTTSKEELLFTETNSISINDYNAIKQEKTTTYKTLSKFEKSTWENEEIIEPLEEMKRFGQ